MTEKKLKEMRSIAISRKGKCLSDIYLGSKTNLSWKCEKGHIWVATPNNIKRGKWCPTCAIEKNASKRRKNIQDMQKLAGTKNGKCLSETYTDMNTKLIWQCELGHIWEARPSNIKRGSWCAECNKGKLGANIRLSIEDMHDLAKRKNGKCLSTEFIGVKKKLKWQCEKDHIWEAAPEHIIYRNRWCPACNGTQRKTIEEMQQLARIRNGKCVSKEYTNIDTNLTWECFNGHQFRSTPQSVGRGAWCPDCASSNTLFFNEEKCRFILESLLQKKFSKTRKVLENHLELDGYNEDLNIAFEYHGIQHYEYKRFFHYNEQGFENQKTRDEQKKNLCKEKSIKLIVVPYKKYSDEDKEKFIIQKLNDYNIQIVKRTVNWEVFYKGLSSFKDLHRIAELKEGKFLSHKYQGSDKKYLWECKEGHQWEASADNIKQGKWCPKCLGKNKTIEDMKKIAMDRGGACISKSYINGRTKLTWKCKNNHMWNSTPESIIQGSWCSMCKRIENANKLKKSIHDMNELAYRKNGKCLSKAYVNAHTKLLWECKEGHQWEATPNKIQQGTWCPNCKKQTFNKLKGKSSP
ncbi:zinc-ribbon domain-containing protein [Priestia megaterium]|uniref:zinc-ribbon domain-containing protein n=1 Tax=Priestia megaterium TaxID=1404 RepID=UPI002ACD3E3D|nr:zinc-ribbon domain-containing protein [Priestia megaterium]